MLLPADEPGDAAVLCGNAADVDKLWPAAVGVTDRTVSNTGSVYAGTGSLAELFGVCCGFYSGLPAGGVSALQGLGGMGWQHVKYKAGSLFDEMCTVMMLVLSSCACLALWWLSSWCAEGHHGCIMAGMPAVPQRCSMWVVGACTYPI